MFSRFDALGAERHGGPRQLQGRIGEPHPRLGADGGRVDGDGGARPGLCRVGPHEGRRERKLWRHPEGARRQIGESAPRRRTVMRSRTALLLPR